MRARARVWAWVAALGFWVGCDGEGGGKTCTVPMSPPGAPQINFRCHPKPTRTTGSCLDEPQICMIKKDISTMEDVRRKFGKPQQTPAPNVLQYVCDQFIDTDVLQHDVVTFNFKDSGVLQQTTVDRMGYTETDELNCAGSPALSVPCSSLPVPTERVTCTYQRELGPSASCEDSKHTEWSSNCSEDGTCGCNYERVAACRCTLGAGQTQCCPGVLPDPSGPLPGTRGAGGAPAIQPTQGGSSSGGQPACLQGSACTCPDGRPGNLQCDANPQGSCACPPCEEFTPGTHVNFNACGGNPAGTWHLASSRNLIGDVSDVIPFKTGVPCAAVAVNRTDIDQANFLLDLGAAGTARSTPFSADLRVMVSTSCLSLLPGSRPGGTCREIALTGATCSDVCGVCECPEGDTLRGSDLVRWKTPDPSVVTLLSQGGRQDSYDYCVQGNRLSLKTKTTEFVFERKFLIGDCKLEDYGVVPGCDFASASTVCAGTAKPCADYPGESCAEPGCTAVSGCEGPEWDCADDCTPGFGCTPGDGGCTGRGSCTTSEVESICSNHAGCSWKPRCTGAPKPCSSYLLDDCLHHAGCSYSTQP